MSDDLYLVFRPIYFAINFIIVLTMTVLVVKGQVPDWHKKFVWFIAWGAAGICVTLAFGMYFGAAHPLSYKSIGYIPEFIVNFSVALIGAAFTWRYYKNKKQPVKTVKAEPKTVPAPKKSPALKRPVVKKVASKTVRKAK
jgi:uncharacterized BrkB/YihY/UPF0761 family membrane protein